MPNLVTLDEFKAVFESNPLYEVSIIDHQDRTKTAVVLWSTSIYKDYFYMPPSRLVVMFDAHGMIQPEFISWMSEGFPLTTTPSGINIDWRWKPTDDTPIRADRGLTDDIKRAFTVICNNLRKI